MKYLPFSFILFGIVGISCSSPLSDTNVTDPSLLEPALMVSKAIDSTGAIIVQYTGDLYDKNFNLVTLQNGSVKINGYQMNLRTNLFGGQEYYLSDQSKVKFDTSTTYTFTLTLSDGTPYYGTVVSQSKDLTEFNTPTTQSRTQNMPLTWNGIDPNATMSIQMIYKFRTAASKDTSGMKTFSIPSGSGGYYTIGSSDLSTPQGIYEVDLTLISKKPGEIDSHFRSGSSITSELEITKNVSIN